VHSSVYKKYGWKVSKLRFDREKGVTCIASILATKLDIHLDQSAPYQKVPKAERKVRLVKERVRCEVASTGYKTNKTLLVHLPKYVVRRLSASLSRKVGVSISPREVLTGQRTDATIELKVGLGEYALVQYPSEDSQQHNSVLASRGRACICLGLACNQEASGVLYDLVKPLNQEPLVADNFTLSPVVGTTVEALSKLSLASPVVALSSETQDDIIEEPLPPLSQPLTEQEYVAVTASAEEQVPTVTDSTPLRDNYTDDTTVPNFSETVDGSDDDDAANSNDVELRGEPMDSSSSSDVTAATLSPSSSEIRGVSQSSSSPSEIRGATTSEIRGATISENRSDSGARTRSQSGVSKRKQTLFILSREIEISKVEVSKVVSVKSYHISMKKGLQTHGDEAVKSIAQELEAMEEKNVFTPINHGSLTQSQRKKAIRSFMFLKEKFKADGSFDKLKSRLTANGKTQDRDEVYRVFGETSSPTISNSSLMSLLTTAKAEDRHIATVDTKNAYLHADLTGSDLVVLLDRSVTKEYEKIRNDIKGMKTREGELYCKLNRALYGTVEGAMAWYKDLTEYLKEVGFEKNPYDHCVFNKLEGDDQLSVGIYVDDLLITCKGKEAIYKLKSDLEHKYKQVNFEDGDKISYLGMLVDNTQEEYIDISMPAYIQQIVSDMKLNPDQCSSTPCSSKVFEVNDNDTLLNNEDKDFFHSVVAKLLYLSKRTRPDILLATTFLCQRVQKPGNEDMKKLSRVAKYLNGTRDMTMRINRDSNYTTINVFVDASFAVHQTMRSHTGAIIAMGGVTQFWKSSKQKLNTKSSTEAELVAISDVLPQAMATAGFVSHQLGQEVRPMIHEDNMSTIALIKAGRPKAESTRHINIRYFLISDYVDQDLIDIQYVPTEDQHGDYYTKPLQGGSFVKHRSYIMGHTDLN